MKQFQDFSKLYIRILNKYELNFHLKFRILNANPRLYLPEIIIEKKNILSFNAYS